MSFRNTFILAIIFVLLAGFLVKMKWQGIEQKVERIFVFNPQEVEEIRLTKDQTDDHLKKGRKGMESLDVNKDRIGKTHRG